MRDLTFAWRRLRGAPVFTVFAIVTLALGIGATTAIWSIVRVVMGPPSGVREPERLINVYHWPSGGLPIVSMSWPDYQDLRASQTAFAELTAWRFFRQALAANGRADTSFGEIVGGEYFQVLGVRAALGRTLLPSDDTPSATPAAVIAHHVWQRMFDGSPDAVGRVMAMNGHAFEIVGVAPPDFRGLFNNGFVPTAVWVPIHSVRLLGDAAGTGYTIDPANRERRWLMVKGRLKPGRTLADAQAEIATIGRRLDAAHPIGRDLDPRIRARFSTSRGWTLKPAREVILNENASPLMRPLAGALMAAVALVLLIACTNLANLMLARVTSRRHDAAVRVALGASRGRLLRDGVAEALILAVAGGLLSLPLTRALLNAIGSEVDMGNGAILRVHPEMDPTVLAGSAAATLLALIVAGVIPAWQGTRVDLRTALASAGSGTAGPRWRGRQLLIAVQVAVSLVLLAIASVSLTEVRRQHRSDSGVDLDRIGVLEVDFALQRVDEARVRGIVDGVLAMAARHPGVEAVGASSGLPVGLGTPGGSVRADGGKPVSVEFVAATPDVLQVLGVPLVRGRALDPRDVAGAERVAIVSAHTASTLFGTIEATGRRAIVKRSRWVGEPDPRDVEVTIVGVAADTDTGWLGSRNRGTVYLPLDQQFERRLVLSARAPGDPAGAAGALRRALASIDPGIAVSRAGVAATVIGPQNLFLEVVMALASLLGAFALVLALAGLYGALSHIVSGRTREMGVRLALGASAPRIVRMVVRDGLVPVLVGIAVGGALAVVARMALQPMFVRMLPKLDPLALALAPASMLIAAVIACYVPARRAARVDPNVALRSL
jgi:predicted permease